MTDTKSLTKPFPDELIRERPFDRLRYVEAGHYVRRLNKAFDHEWSLEILEHSRVDKYVMVRVRISSGEISKESFGGSRITKDVADAYKSAVTDGMKKCAWMLGVGVENWIDPEIDPHPLLEEVKNAATAAGFSPSSLIPAIRKRFQKAPEALTKEECLSAIEMIKTKQKKV
ncbi:MAG: Rad52/Rad22 family DNA repair protein [Planctomycetota bacterium]